MSAEEKKEVLDLVDEALDWMDENPEASKDEIDNQRKEVEQVAIPLMRQAYSGRTSDGDEEEYFDDSDL